MHYPVRRIRFCRIKSAHYDLNQTTETSAIESQRTMLNTGRLVQTLCLAVSCMNLKTRVEQFVQFGKLLIGCGGGGVAFDDDRLNAYVTAALACRARCCAHPC